ncbi:hypothetical protein AMECASPLE_032957 [Ameca splendens]|uniref:Uncharacterized protein n=1 Tax=Ameca splendens TaxID=208324 RepID=A0ABV0Z4L7_9TELE
MPEKLQMMPDLTLSKAVDLVRQSEQVQQHVSEQGASACANLSEVAHKRQQHRDKLTNSESHANRTQESNQNTVKILINVTSAQDVVEYIERMINVQPGMLSVGAVKSWVIL